MPHALVELKKLPAPPGQVLARERLGFSGYCQVCHKSAKLESYCFSCGPEEDVPDYDGAKIRDFDLTCFELCSYECFVQTEYYKAQMSGKETCRPCGHLKHEVGKCPTTEHHFKPCKCNCGVDLLRY